METSTKSISKSDQKFLDKVREGTLFEYKGKPNVLGIGDGIRFGFGFAIGLFLFSLMVAFAGIILLILGVLPKRF